jgi:hypothetical protein
MPSFLVEMESCYFLPGLASCNIYIFDHFLSAPPLGYISEVITGNVPVSAFITNCRTQKVQVTK